MKTTELKFGTWYLVLLNDKEYPCVKLYDRVVYFYPYTDGQLGVDTINDLASDYSFRLIPKVQVNFTIDMAPIEQKTKSTISIFD